MAQETHKASIAADQVTAETTMQTHPLRLFSYTRTERDAGCARSLYLSREWGGTGLVPKSTGWDLVYGNILHKWLDKLAQNGSISYLDVRTNVFTEAMKAFGSPAHAKDWATQAEGLLRGFIDTVWPLWMAEYEVLEPEAWLEWEVEPGYKFRARRDLLLKSKFDGHISYREYKSTSTTKEEYFASYSKDVQLHTGMVVEKYANGREIRDGVVQSFYKGYKDKKLKTQRSVFSHGYVNRQYSMVPDYSYERKYGKGWELFSTYDEFPDLTGWVAGLKNKHPDILSEQLGRTAPIFPREDIVKKFFKQQMFRQKEVAEGVELLQKCTNMDEIDDILDKYFPQNFSKCEPKYGGFNCEFRPICWQPWIGADPIGSGLFDRYSSDMEKAVEVVED
jgi:hypothetical protein